MYDLIIIGARCAGAPLAMVMAAKGFRVLVVDKADFPSDTLSTHQIQTAGAVRLKKWGILDELVARGTPPVREVMLDLGEVTLRSPFPSIEGVDACYAPRRTLLDELLVEHARRAGAEVRTRFIVEDFIVQDGTVSGIRGRSIGGSSVEEKARWVVGADGRNSTLARFVSAPFYDERPTLSCMYYTYFSGVDRPGMEVYMRPDHVVITCPTSGGQTMVCVQRLPSDFSMFKQDIEGTYWRTISKHPDLYECLRAGRRDERFMGMGHSPNFFRKPYGKGWALVGDAGYHRDPTFAQGMTDAFRDVELLSFALEGGLREPSRMDVLLADYEQTRNRLAKPMYEMVCQAAMLGVPPVEVRALHEALRDNHVERQRFFGVMTGAVHVEEFFNPLNIDAIINAAEG